MADDPNISPQPNPIPSGGTPTPTPATATPTANTTIVSTLQGIQKSLDSIHNILKNGIVFQKKLVDKQNQRDQADKRKVRETVTESAKSKGIRPKDIKQLIKSFTPIDFIKNFIYYTIMGFVTTNLLKFYPQLLGILKLISPIISVFEGIVGGIFNIFVFIVDKTYAVFDKIRDLTKVIGGENFQNAFDKFSSTMNTFFNVLILTGMAVGAALLDPNIRDSVLGKKEGVAGRGGTKGGGRTGMTPAQERYLNRFGEGAYRKKFGATPAQERYLSRFGEGKFARRFGFRPKAPSMGAIAKSGLKIGKSARFIKGNILFGVIELIAKVATGERLDKALVTTAGSVLGAGIGQVAGGIVGGVLGTVVPFIGNAVLATVGAIAGGILGGYLGDMLGEMLYNGISSWVQSTMGPKTAHAGGGSVPTRGGQIVRKAPIRTIKRMPQSLRRIPHKKVIPGKDIGGKKQLEKILRNPTDPKYKNPMRMLMSNSDVMGRKAARGGFVMEIMKLGQDMASLGQKPDRQRIDLISDNFSIFIKNIIRDQTSKNIARTTQSVFAMADGGYVPTSRTLDVGDPIGDQFKKLFKNLLTRSINNVSVEIFRNIKKELSLLDEQGGGPGGGAGVGEIGSISIGDFSAEDIDLLGRMIYAESSGESDLGKAAVLSVILNRWRLIKSGQVTPGTFNVKGATKDTITLKDILFADAQFSPVADGSLNATSSDQGKDALAKAIKANGNDPQKLYNNLIAQNYSAEDAEYIVKAAFFATTANSRFMRAVRLGGHVFQQSSNSQFRGKIQDISSMQANVTYNQGLININPQDYKNLQGLIIENQNATPIRSWEQLEAFGHHGRGPSASIDRTYGNRYDFNLVINGSTDVPLLAPISGEVIRAKDIGDGYGYSVVIKGSNPGDGTALIGHLKYMPSVKEGNNVIAFQTIIGIQGSTGRSTGPHVHISAKKHVISRYVNFYIQLSKMQKNSPPKGDQRRASNSILSATNNIASNIINFRAPNPEDSTQMRPIPKTVASKANMYSDEMYNTEKHTAFVFIRETVPQLA